MEPIINNPKKRRIAELIPVFLIAGVLIWIVWMIGMFAYGQKETVAEIIAAPIEFFIEKPKHVELPEEVRGIYWTAYTTGGQRGKDLLLYMQETGLNSVVIDLKMDDGALAFTPNDESLLQYTQSYPAISDLDEVLEKLHEANVYRIARIAVMRDAVFARVNPEVALRWGGGSFWQDAIGSLWVDPAAPKVADYAIQLAREAYDRGFDEVQFDYVRFPSDGKISSIKYPVFDGVQDKTEVMQTFFRRLNVLREEGIPVSYDLFGMTFWSEDDFNIGQRLVDTYPYADFISPMVYPSHYPNGFEGFSNPALNPYEIVKRSLDKGGEMMGDEARSHFRPWLQDFDIGAVYTSDLIEAQIKASRDAGASGWIFWNARNVYERADYRGL